MKKKRNLDQYLDSQNPENEENNRMNNTGSRLAMIGDGKANGEAKVVVDEPLRLRKHGDDDPHEL